MGWPNALMSIVSQGQRQPRSNKHERKAREGGSRLKEEEESEGAQQTRRGGGQGRVGE